MNYFRKQLIFFSGMVFMTSLYAQEAVTSAGDSRRVGNLNVSWTVGEALTETLTTTNFKLTQGVQQPSIKVEIVSRSQEMNVYRISAYPNPATDAITVSISDADRQQFMLKVFDMNGKLMHIAQITESQTRISVANFPPGIYLMQISDRKNNIQVFKIIKN